jgi:3-phosphoshikimate 1-carboxyvinyltransferase
MKLVISKSRIKGTVCIPASKSHTIRAVTIASLADGKSSIRSPLVSNDTLSAVDCFRALGATIDTQNPDCWTVTGNAGIIQTLQEPIDVGNSGTTLRIAAASAALSKNNNPIQFTGDEQIQSRPIQPLLDAINDLGASAKSINSNGKAPISIAGTLTGGSTTIKCITSQYLTSLLMAAPLAQNDTTINITLLNEPGYVQMTLDWLDRQNIQYQNKNFKRFTVKGCQQYKPFEYTIPADFSSATFFLCAAAIIGENVKISNLDFNDSQPDKAVIDYLLKMGADIKIENNSAIVSAAELHGTDIDMNPTPDALPAMAVTAAFASGTTRLLNVPQARCKETDRITAIADELKKMNVNVKELPDGLIIEKSSPAAADLNGKHDHRIVMALAVAAMAVSGTSTIDTAQAVNVTFPNFVNLMKNINANINLK